MSCLEMATPGPDLDAAEALRLFTEPYGGGWLWRTVNMSHGNALLEISTYARVYTTGRMWSHSLVLRRPTCIFSHFIECVFCCFKKKSMYLRHVVLVWDSLGRSWISISSELFLTVLQMCITTMNNTAYYTAWAYLVNRSQTCWHEQRKSVKKTQNQAWDQACHIRFSHNDPFFSKIVFFKVKSKCTSECINKWWWVREGEEYE